MVFPIHKAVRDKLKWSVGELLIARVHGPFLILRLADPPTDFPLTQIPPDAWPPSWPGKKPDRVEESD